MLVEFKVGNYLSFKDVSTFSMVGYTPIKEHESNYFYHSNRKNKLLKSSVCYGANGSGKSNLLSAMSYFKNFILTSSNEGQSGDEINVINFLLSTETDGKPSFFEMIFFIDDIRYRYGFEVDRKIVYSEWLFSLKNNNSAKETKLFTRDFQSIDPRPAFKEGKGLESRTRPNALFISTVAQLNGKISSQILSWFKLKFNIISGLEDTTTSYTVGKFLEEDFFKKQIIEFFKTIKIGFDDIEVIEKSDLFEKTLKKIPNEISNEFETLMSALEKFKEKIHKSEKIESTHVSMSTLHKKFDSKNKFLKYENLDFGLQSEGTRKIFGLLGPIIDTIQNNKILVVDELDTRLHPLLTLELIKFFHSKANEKAQLIFVSHDTNLLKKEIFRRDQIWFTEKDHIGATDLYSLVEYKVNQDKVRNDASFEKDYLLGKYGAIPFLSNIQEFINNFLYEQEKEQE